MFRKFIISLFISFSFAVFSQTDTEPVVWKTSFMQINETEFDIIFEATIAKDWHVYSQYNPDEASLPLVISSAEENANYQLIGKAKESKTYKEFSDIWEKEEIFFKDKAILTQRIQLTNKEITTIKLNVFGQVCKEVCINFDENFEIQLAGNSINNSTIKLDEKSKILSEKLHLNLKNKELLEDNSTSKNNSNLLNIFLLGLFGGFLALLTPCVFPMIPLTVSFFTKQNQSKSKGLFQASLYGFFIVFIYVLLSVPFHFLDNINPEILNTISTNIWLNIFFFIILVVFAFSFFGFFEITLPNSWASKMDNASNIGGAIGIFFMALTLAIVSFSCTGPILGSLLAGSLSATDGAWQLTAGMSGFGLALALPFAMFAFFPNWLTALPKSGGWLQTTKVVLGFLELAFAFKFLSNADLVGHWGILKREVFIGIWILIFVILSIYLFGKLRFTYDTKNVKISIQRKVFGFVSLAFAIYMIPGLLQKPLWNLSFLSGFPPPQFYSIYQQESDCPLGLNCFKDFDTGLAYAKKVNKPILLDFTGWNCVNCRQMEENVWSDPKIYELLKNEYVLISLYVDDYENQLPESKQFTYLKSNGKTKEIKNVGAKWATFQTVNFNTASQPFYVLLSPDLEVLNTSLQYTNVNNYYNWLQRGLTNFKK